MRVLHVAEIVIGGIGTYLEELLLWQGEAYGHDQVAAIVPQNQMVKMSAEAKAAATMLPYQRASRDPLSLMRLSREIAEQVRKFKPDIIHAHSSFAGFLTRLPVITNSVPVIYSPNGWAFDRDDPKFVRFGYAVLERLAARRAAAIITCSEHETRVAVGAGVPRQHIHVIPHGIGEHRLALQDSLPTPADQLKLLFIGRLDQQKGFDWLMRAMALIPQERVSLTVAGSSVFGEKPQLLEQDNIRYLGWVEASQIDSYIDACDAVVMPSRWEGYPFVALETMRRGRGLLVSDRGSMPEVIGDNGAGRVFRLDDVESLKQAVLDLDTEAVVKMAGRARENFLAKHTAEKMNVATAALYDRVMSHA